MSTVSSQPWRSILMILLAAYAAVHLSTGLLPPFAENIDAKISDQMFRLRQRINPPDYNGLVVHVDLNNTSIRRLDDHYLNRSHHARVIRNMAGMKVSSQLYDFIFAARAAPGEDRDLIQATANAASVYFGMAFQLNHNREHTSAADSTDLIKRQDRYLQQALWHIRTEGNPESIPLAYDAMPTFIDLAKVSKGLGVLNLTFDDDGVLRRSPLLYRFKDGYFPSFAFRAVCDYLGVPPERIVLRPGQEIVLQGALPPDGDKPLDIHIPVDERGLMRINFIGPWGVMRHYNFADIHQADQNPEDAALWREELAGKMAVVAEITTGSAHMGAVPTDDQYPLCGVHSSVVHTMLTGRFITEPALWQQLLVELFMLILMLFMARYFSVLWFSMAVLIVTGMYVASASLAFAYFGVVAQFVRPLSAIWLGFIGLLVARTIDSTRHYIDAEKAKAVAERELAVGRQIQSDFFPAALPEVEGWAFAAQFQPASQVTGDFYDTFTMDGEQKVVVVVGDVCDHGVGSALFMVLFRSLIRTFALQDHCGVAQMGPGRSQAGALAQIIAKTNAYVAETHAQADMFATLFLAAVDPSTGKITYVNAGHEPPLIIRNDGTIISLKKTGPVVGLYPDLDYGTGEVSIAPGETLFIQTDGVTEAQDTDGAMFGKKRLHRLLSRGDRSPRQLVETVVSELTRHLGSARAGDDITLLAIRRLPKV